MPASVGARPGTSVAAAAHISAPKPSPMPAKRGAERVARGAQVAQDGDQQQRRRSRGRSARRSGSRRWRRRRSARRTWRRRRRTLERPAVASSSRSRAAASSSVGGLVVADGGVRGAAVLGQRAASSTERDVRLARRSWRAPRRSSRWPASSVAALNTSVACVPDCAGKRCSSRSWAFWDSMPGTVKSSLNAPPAAIAPPITRDRRRAATASVAARGRRPTRRRCGRGGRSWRGTIHRLSLKINSV